jgi:predicted DNA-binding transcriptional regulator YafY
MAAKEGRRVRLHYRAGGVDSERDFDTYGLAYYGGYWYAVGHCYLRQDMRTFRLDRVRQVLPARGLVRRPPGFDALEHLRLAVATVPRRFAARILMQTDLESARRACIDTIGLFEQTADGVLLHNQSDELGWLARQLAAVPFEIRVLEPEALRDELRTVGERLLRAAL